MHVLALASGHMSRRVLSFEAITIKRSRRGDDCATRVLVALAFLFSCGLAIGADPIVATIAITANPFTAVIAVFDKSFVEINIAIGLELRKLSPAAKIYILL
jgi:hypothetical protein